MSWRKKKRGAEKVRFVKLQSLRRDFEYARMKENELLKDYLTKINDVINKMKSYGEKISDRRIVEKILIILPQQYNSIVSFIGETKDLSSLSVRELKSSLQSFDHRLDKHAKYSVESAFQALTMDVKGRSRVHLHLNKEQSKPNYSAKQELERKELEFQMERNFSEEFLFRAIFHTRKVQNL